jgi:intron-binding protein aquarius
MFKQLVAILRFYQGFEINNFTGNALSDEEIRKLHYKKMQRLQVHKHTHTLSLIFFFIIICSILTNLLHNKSVVWKLFPQQLRKFALSNIAAIDSRSDLKRHLSVLSDDQLRQLCQHLNLLGPRVWKSSSSEQKY